MCKRKKYRLIRIIFMMSILILAGCILLKVIKLNTLWTHRYPIQGIDVSHYQGDIDWQILQNQGIDFAFIKATEGSSSIDEKFFKNWKEASDTSIKIGAYHFFSFDSKGQTQAENYIQTVGSLNDKLVPVVDVEYYGNKAKNPPPKENVISELTDMLQFLEQEYGVKPIIYTTYPVYYKYLDEAFTEYPLWIRDVYLYPITLKDQWTFWQYSDTAVLEGYNGPEKYIDKNVFYGDMAELNEFIVLPKSIQY